VESYCEHGSDVSGSLRCWDVLGSRATGKLWRRFELHGVAFSYLVSAQYQTFFGIHIFRAEVES
jgi:hypothetical protein